MSRTGAEGDRRLGNLLQVGEIVSVDPGAATARVRFEGLETHDIPWMQPRAGAGNFWWPPEVGEWVMVGAPSGDLAQSVILGSVNTGRNPAHGAPETFRLTFGGSDYLEWAGGNLTIQCSGTVTINGARIDLN